MSNDKANPPKEFSGKAELSKILPTLTNDEVDPREDDHDRRDAEIAGDRPPHH